MKKTIIATTLVLMLASFGVMVGQMAKKNAAPAVTKSAKIEVYYFHYTRRCVTCQAIEDEAKKAIPSMYPNQYKSKKIAFIAVNLDKKENKALATKCKAEGQSLLIVSGNKRVDLTEQAFLYAKSNPEKLRQILKKTIDPLIK